MADDKKGVKQPAGEDTSVPATPAEEPKTTEEAPQEQAEVKEPQTDEPVEGAEPEGESAETGESKKGFSARVRQLNARTKKAEAENQSLRGQIAELTGQVGQGQMTPFNSQVVPGAEVTPEQYREDVNRTAASIVDLKLQQERMFNRINQEAGEAMKDNPELDPSSDSFNKELSSAVTEATLAFVKANPTASVRQFVSKLMKPYKKAVTAEVGQQTAEVAKQVAQAATKPTSVTKEEKNFGDLSLSEMEKKLGFVS